MGGVKQRLFHWLRCTPLSNFLHLPLQMYCSVWAGVYCAVWGVQEVVSQQKCAGGAQVQKRGGSRGRCCRRCRDGHLLGTSRVQGMWQNLQQTRKPQEAQVPWQAEQTNQEAVRFSPVADLWEVVWKCRGIECAQEETPWQQTTAKLANSKQGGPCGPIGQCVHLTEQVCVCMSVCVCVSVCVVVAQTHIFYMFISSTKAFTSSIKHVRLQHQKCLSLAQSMFVTVIFRWQDIHCNSLLGVFKLHYRVPSNTQKVNLKTSYFAALFRVSILTVAFCKISPFPELSKHVMNSEQS